MRQEEESVEVKSVINLKFLFFGVCKINCVIAFKPPALKG
jgi:hypothetical protein